MIPTDGGRYGHGAARSLAAGWLDGGRGWASREVVCVCVSACRLSTPFVWPSACLHCLGVERGTMRARVTAATNDPSVAMPTPDLPPGATPSGMAVSATVGARPVRQLVYDDDEGDNKYKAYQEQQNAKMWTFVLVFTLCAIVFMCSLASYVVLEGRKGARVDATELARAELALSSPLEKEVRFLRKQLVEEEKKEAKLQGEFERIEKATKSLRDEESKRWAEENQRWRKVAPEMMQQIRAPPQPVPLHSHGAPHVPPPIAGLFAQAFGPPKGVVPTTNLNGDPNKAAETVEKVSATAPLSPRAQTIVQAMRATALPGASNATVAEHAGHGAWEPSPSHHRMARAIVKTLSTEDLVGAVMVIGVDSYEYTPSLHKAVKEGRLAGIFLHRDVTTRTKDVRTVKTYTDWLQARARVAWGDSLPLIIASDDEGGHFNNYPYAYQEWPNNLAVAAVNDTTKAYEYGREYGKNIRSTGINMVFAPCMDVNIEPLNPVIGLRSFGSDPAEVGRMGVAVMQGFLASGVFPTLKHFPGHGRTKLDSHVALPSISASVDSLEKTELLPFQKAIDAGVPLIMAGHLVVPALDKKPGWPSTFSKTILSDRLRKQMGFRGILVTDSLSMAGAKKVAAGLSSSPGEVFLQSLLAGNDLLMDSTSLHPGVGDWNVIFTYLATKANGDAAILKRLRQAAARVIALRLSMHEARQRARADPPTKTVEGEKLVRELYARSTTVVRDENALLPLGKEHANSKDTLLIIPNSLNVKETEAAFLGARVVHFSPNVPCTDRSRVEQAIQDWLADRPDDESVDAGRIVLAVHDFNVSPMVLMHTVYKEQLELAWKIYGILSEKPRFLKKVVFASVENPYDLIAMPAFPTIAVAFGSGGEAMKMFWERLVHSNKNELLPRALPVDLPLLDAKMPDYASKHPPSRDAECAHTHSPAAPSSGLPKKVEARFGSAGDSCETVCVAAKKVCAPQYFNAINTCDVLRTKFSCNECLENLGMDQPAQVKQSASRWPGRCLFTSELKTEVGFHGVERCMAKHPDTIRLCPCVPS